MKYSRETYLIVRYFGELSNNIYSEASTDSEAQASGNRTDVYRVKEVMPPQI